MRITKYGKGIRELGRVVGNKKGSWELFSIIGYRKCFWEAERMVL